MEDQNQDNTEVGAEAEASVAVATPVDTKAADLQKKEAERMDKMRKEIASRYPHAIVSTLRWAPEAKKFQCQIKCVISGNTDRWVYTSDLFQVKMCVVEADKAKKAAKTAKKAEIAAARDLIKAGGLKK